MDRNLYAKIQICMQSLDTYANAYVFFKRDNRDCASSPTVIPLYIYIYIRIYYIYRIYVSLSYFRRTRGNTVVRDHVVRDGQIREEMGVVPDHAFRRPRLRLLHVRSRR